MLTKLEELILGAIKTLEPEAFPASIHNRIYERTDRYPSIGALYNALDRLEAEGLISSKLDAGRPIKGGKARRICSLTQRGHKALTRSLNDLVRIAT